MSQYATSENIYSKQTPVYNEYVQVFKTKSNSSLGDLMVKSALYFRGKPYVASTLDNNEEEQLVVNLQEFDCNTFVETCMALVLTLKNNNKTFDTYKSILQKIRYRGGYIDGYASRLHYVLDWKNDNERKQILSDITPSIGGTVSDKSINFMSTHTHLYKRLQNNLPVIQQIANIEDSVTNNHDYFVINKKEINTLEDKIKDGDIIAFATSINGLDYSHIAIAYYTPYGLSFIHASTRAMCVIVESESLYSYCMKSKKCTGISIYRLNNSVQ